MENPLFIINPIAGGGRGKSVIPLIEKKMQENNINYEIILTTQPLEATKITENNVNRFSTIVAVGGDGTVNEVAKGLINSKKGTLGIIPCGTGNDFGKVVGIPTDLNKALDILIEGKKRKIDVGKINGYNFLNIASIGFDTEVVVSTNIIKKKIKNKIAYILGILATLINYKRKKVNLLIDNVRYDKDLVLMAVGNGNFYGGGLEVLPMAIIDDGFFHICLVKDISNLKILFLFPSIFKGQHIKYTKFVEIYKAKRVEVKNPEGMSLNIDGEIIHINKDIIFEIDDYKLDVIFS